MSQTMRRSSFTHKGVPIIVLTFLITVIGVICHHAIAGENSVKRKHSFVSEAPKGDLYGLIIGITYYKHSDIPDLKWAAKDAEDFAAFLKSQRQLYKNIHLKVLVNERATRARIQRTLDHGFNLAGEIDRLIFFFSGHGVVDPKMKDGYYLMAFDSDPKKVETTAVHISSGKIVERIEARSSLMITDTCHSKQVGDPYSETAGERLLELVHRTTPLPNRLFLASTRILDQPRKYSHFKNGLFTSCLLQGMKGKADENHDGCVVIKEAADYALKKVASFTNSKQKVFFEGIVQDPFPLAKGKAKANQGKVKSVKPKGDLYALVVGVSDYKSPAIQDLTFAAKDAKDFADFIKAQGALYNKINLDVLLDKDATKQRIEDILSKTFEIAKQEDTLLVFFSGHGETLPEREDEYFTYVHDTDPNNLLKTGLLLSGMRMIKEVKSQHAIVISDTCFAGASVDLQTKSGGMSLKEFARVFRNNPNRIIISSSSTPEQSMEFPHLKNGVFTYFLLTGLRGEADSNKDGIVTVTEAYEYVSKSTRDFTQGDQNPTIEGRVDGFFPLSIIPRKR